MNPTPRFLEFATAFEKSFADDDWSRVAAFLTEDAVYAVTGGAPLGGRWEGRDAVVGQFKQILDDFDRRFEVRKTEIVGAPTIEDGRFRFEWRGTYSTAGKPDLVIGGIETAIFEGDLISFLEDSMHEGCDAGIQAHMAEHVPD